MGLICLALTLAFWTVVIGVVLSWVAGAGRLPFDHPVRRLFTAIDKVIQPVLRPLRSVLPPIRLGRAALDLSPLVLIFGIQIVTSILC